MKKITLLALGLLGIYACSDSNSKNSSGFEIKGNLSNSKGESIYLEKLSPAGVSSVDSSVVNEKGEFVMNHYWFLQTTN